MTGVAQPWLVKRTLNDSESVISHHSNRGEALIAARSLNRQYQTDEYTAEEWDPAKAAQWPMGPRELPADYV